MDRSDDEVKATLAAAEDAQAEDQAALAQEVSRVAAELTTMNQLRVNLADGTFIMVAVRNDITPEQRLEFIVWFGGKGLSDLLEPAKPAPRIFLPGPGGGLS